MHVREGYKDLDRRSWRVFMWVDGQCHGVPEVLGRDKNMRQILPDVLKEELGAKQATDEVQQRRPQQQVPIRKIFG